MDLIAPLSYSPSSLSQFTTCPLAFRFSYIDKIPSPPQLAATKGSIVHRALEFLFNRDSQDRTNTNAHIDLDKAFEEYSSISDLVDLNLDEVSQKNLEVQSHQLIDKYFEIENPKYISPVGLELKLQARIGNTTVRGVIDRLEIDEAGELIVTDYKTGSVPKQFGEASKMSGVHLYALLCREVFGKVPVKVQLIYLSGPQTIIASPNLSSLKGVEIKTKAIHKAVESACERGEFRPNESALCNWCSYQELCPAKGGSLP